MKTIKIKFCGFSSGGQSIIDEENNPITAILKKHYNVQFSEKPDYVICSMFDGVRYRDGIFDSYISYDCVRIFIEGENYVPDYNLVDYSICSYPITFFDRNYYLPCGVEAFFRCGFKNFMRLAPGTRVFGLSELKDKCFFANFIYGHPSDCNVRDDFFQLLSKYKRVESPGTWLNNMPEGFCGKLSWTDDSKINFQKKCKFTICFESIKHEGFITEKIVDAFLANTIPIYYGSENIDTIFNEKAFINCNKYKSLEAVIEEVIRIDNDDALYCKMLREPVFKEENYQEKLLSGLERFLTNIFDQDKTQAYRRSLYSSPFEHEKFIERSQTREFEKLDVEETICALYQSIICNAEEQNKSYLSKLRRMLLLNCKKIGYYPSNQYDIYKTAFPCFMNLYCHTVAFANMLRKSGVVAVFIRLMGHE